MANTGAKAVKRKSISYEKWGYFFVAPFIIVFIVFQLFPLIQTFYFSFFKYFQKLSGDIGPDFIGFKNYVDLLSGGQIYSYLGNTLIMWILGFIPQIVISLLFAYWFTSVRLRLKCLGLFKTVMYMPNLIMAAAFSMMFFFLFDRSGPINEIVKIFNEGEAFIFLDHAWSSRLLVALMNFLMWFGNTTILLMAAMMGVDASLVEAAEIDGCTSSQIFWKIVLPIIRPILIYVLITSLIGGLQMYDVPAVLLGKSSGGPLLNGYPSGKTLIMFLNDKVNGNTRDLGSGGALSVLIFIVCAALSLFVYYFFTDAGVERREKKRALKAAKKGGK